MATCDLLLLCGGTIHDWRSVGDVMHKRLVADGRFSVTRVDDDLTVLSAPDLSRYAAIVFYYTRGEISDAQMNGLSRYVRNGGAFVGVHGATASFRESPEFHALLGGLFIGHPAPREYCVGICDPEHPITEGLDREFRVFDEQYTFDYDPRVRILATAQWNGEQHPVAWVKPWGHGRVYYLALGHDGEIAQQEMFGTLLIRGTAWAAGVL
jgi:type 1 glutamine amidotransferase